MDQNIVARMTETDLQRRIQIALSGPYTRPMRNNVGQGWLGSTFEVRDGRLYSGLARRVHFGLAPGSSDLIGPHSVIVTPEMIGKRVALFLALEVKSQAGRVTPEQQAFVDMVRGLGGLSGVVRSVEEALGVVG